MMHDVQLTCSQEFRNWKVRINYLSGSREPQDNVSVFGKAKAFNCHVFRFHTDLQSERDHIGDQQSRREHDWSHGDDDNVKSLSFSFRSRYCV